MPGVAGGRQIRSFTTPLYSTLALLSFAANSILCRLALGPHAIDAASFTTIRIASGAVALFVIHAASRGPRPAHRGWSAPAMLFVYAAGFSLAYRSLGAATGALVLFGAVQSTMLLSGLIAGERFRLLEGLGLCLAIAGLIALVLPGLTAPPLTGLALMATAGVAWGIYSLRGRGSSDPLGDTLRNFLVAVPLAVLVSALSIRDVHASGRGILLAIVSGALTSGMGYVLWFLALRGLSAIRAATVQLAVPALAAGGAVVFLREPLTARLVQAGLLILGGVGLAVTSRAQTPRR